MPTDDQQPGESDTESPGTGTADRIRRVDLPPVEDEPTLSDSALSEGDELAARLDVDPDRDDVKG